MGLVISLLLLADLSLTFLTLLQFFSISLEAFLLVLLILPLASVLASAAGLNALFSHGPRRAAGLARVYALWNITSFTNVVSPRTHKIAHLLDFIRTYVSQHVSQLRHLLPNLLGISCRDGKRIWTFNLLSCDHSDCAMYPFKSISREEVSSSSRFAIDDPSRHDQFPDMSWLRTNPGVFFAVCSLVLWVLLLYCTSITPHGCNCRKF